MNHLNYEMEYLKETFIELLELGKSQLARSIKALVENNLEVAEEIIRTEKRVNALELSIEKTCENILALFQPVATDLRFVLAIFKSVSDIERIADHAEFIAGIIKERNENPLTAATLEKYEVPSLFTQVDAIYGDLIEAFETTNSDIARQAFRKDKNINQSYRKLVQLMKEDMLNVGTNVDILEIYSILARLERSSNLLTNIAEEIIFYIDAEILKHKKKKKKAIGKDSDTEE